ncbi:hypothetical protein BV25DRAFT_1790372, partial [Artomyces pyxidatus]
RRNEHLPIFRLPSEILACIFAINRTTPRIEEFGAEHLRWIAVTHVCRRWRQVALDFPDLWTRGCFKHGLNWTKEMFARSKTAPLYLEVTWSRTAKENGALIKAHMFHIRTLTLRTAISDTEFLAQPAPILESFVLKDSEIPLCLFANQAPRLHSAKLVDCTFSWSCLLLLRNLVHVSIINTTH